MDGEASLGAAYELQLVHLQSCMTAQQALLVQLRDSSTRQQAIRQLHYLANDFKSALDGLETTFRLFDLPRELRYAIYKLCIGHGKIFLPNSFECDVRYRDRKDYDKPQWQLLAINKQIRMEAMETLFIDNQIIFSDVQRQVLLSSWGFQWKTHFASRFDEPAPLLSLSNHSRKLLTSISLAIDSRSQVPGLNECVSRAIGLSHRKEVAARIQEEYDEIHQAHARVVSYDVAQWYDLVRTVLSYQKLRHLEIDMTHSYCSLGCCSRAKVVISQIFKRLEIDDFPSTLESIDIAGLKTKSEQQRVIELLERGNRWLKFVDRDHEDCKDAARNRSGRIMTLCLKGFDSEAHHQNGGEDFRLMFPERVNWTVPERTFVFVQCKPSPSWRE